MLRSNGSKPIAGKASNRVSRLKTRRPGDEHPQQGELASSEGNVAANRVGERASVEIERRAREADRRACGGKELEAGALQASAMSAASDMSPPKVHIGDCYKPFTGRTLLVYQTLCIRRWEVLAPVGRRSSPFNWRRRKGL